jgi:hypothetical protein
LVSEDQLRELLQDARLNKTDQLLAILGVEPEIPKTVSKIREIGRTNGLPEIAQRNVSALLKATRGVAISLPQGWVLTAKGRKELVRKVPDINIDTTPTASIAVELRKHLGKIKDADTLAFLDEAIRCYESKPPLYRAAVVLSWVGAMSVLYNHIIRDRLIDFNAEARKRDRKWRDVKAVDGFSRMREHDFLDIIEALGIIGKNVKQELQNNCLHLRNSCGHPNSFQVGEHRAAAHLETLIQNVFAKF